MFVLLNTARSAHDLLTKGGFDGGGDISGDNLERLESLNSNACLGYMMELCKTTCAITSCFE